VNVVFGGGLWPLGWSVGYVERPLEDACDRYRSADVSASKLTSLPDQPLLGHLEALLPFEMPYTRRLLVGTASGWTAVFDNSRGGGDPLPAVAMISGDEVRYVMATHIPADQFSLPATQFHLLGPGGDGGFPYIRTIDAGRFDSGRWEFLVDGEVQPFEEVEAYSKRLIRDRLTRSMLLRYLAALGIDADEPSFYGRAMLAEGSLRVRRDRWSATLDRARRESLGELPWS
jgi:hypothetical protein